MRRTLERDSSIDEHSIDDFSIYLAAIASADAMRMIQPLDLFTHLEKVTS